jgi:hypothetical protein
LRRGYQMLGEGGEGEGGREEGEKEGEMVGR